MCVCVNALECRGSTVVIHVELCVRHVCSCLLLIRFDFLEASFSLGATKEKRGPF